MSVKNLKLKNGWCFMDNYDPKYSKLVLKYHLYKKIFYIGFHSFDLVTIDSNLWNKMKKNV